MNRSTSQVYAFLFFTQRSLTAEQICEALSLARSNVSTSLKELLQDGLVLRDSKLGERSDYFKALDDGWETLQRIAAARRRKELDPTIALVRNTLKEIKGEGAEDAVTRRRATEMLKFLELAAIWEDEFQRFSPKSLARLSRLSNHVLKLIRGTIGGAEKEAGK
jgi:DNA-binding transcriptional regulator GbsR (MarR family)